METGNDGCVLELSTDEGDSWFDLGDHITWGGYSHVIDGHGNPIDGQPAWSGSTGPSLSLVEVDLGPFAGSMAKLGFRLACDNSWAIPDSGWHVDDLLVEGVDCEPWMTPVETISVTMVCTPQSGTLPLHITVGGVISNHSTTTRLVDAFLDLQLASGYYLTDLVSSTGIQVKHDNPLNWEFNRIFPGHPLMVGINYFHVSVYDTTPSPFNQPPYAASGWTDGDICGIECVVP